jgi:hypothetical protein
MARTSITIVLELDETDSPVGSACLPDGTRRTFHGWLALSEAIDSLAGTDARGDANNHLSADTADGNPTEGSSSS